MPSFLTFKKIFYIIYIENQERSKAMAVELVKALLTIM